MSSGGSPPLNIHVQIIKLLLLGKEKYLPAFLAPSVGLSEVCLFESFCCRLRNKLGCGKREIRMKILLWYLYPLGQCIRAYHNWAWRVSLTLKDPGPASPAPTNLMKRMYIRKRAKANSLTRESPFHLKLA